MFCSKPAVKPDDPNYLTAKFYGSARKSITEDMVCFQQAATNYLQYYRRNNMHMPWKIQEMNQQGDTNLVQFEIKLAKYLERMFEIV